MIDENEIPVESVVNSCAASPEKKNPTKKQREKRFKQLMGKIRVNGDAWIK